MQNFFQAKTDTTDSGRTPETAPDNVLTSTPTTRALTIAEEIDALTDPSFMTSLARGLAVIKAFSDQRRAMTIAQLSHKTGIPRAAVRRCLYTLKQLGYADAEANNFYLKPKILSLGYSYLSSTPLTISAQPALNEISRELNESCSLGVLEDHEVIYISRSQSSRVMSVALNAGSRIPAYCSSMGRVLLSTFSEDELSAYFEAVRMVAFTDRTVTEESQLRDILNDVRQRGYAIVEEELEIGLRSIAVPVRGASGMPVAALCIGAQVGRADRSQLEQGFLPLLLNTASDLSVLLP